MKIAVAGTGYVGLSLAVLLAQHNDVTAVDIQSEKVALINHGKSPIRDKYIEDFLAEKALKLRATTDGKSAYRDAELVIIATPTNYDSKKNFFDTSAVESVIRLVMRCNPNAYMVIKSTIPVGYTRYIREELETDKVFLARSSCVRAMRFTTISIRAASSSARTQRIRSLMQWHIALRHFCSRGQRSRILIHCSWASLRLRQSNCSRIHIWLFVCRTSMSSIPMLR